MIKTITNAGFVSNKTGLAFDVILEKIEVTEDGFDCLILKVFKNTDGTISEEAPQKRDRVFVTKADKLNLWNNVTGDMETKIIAKLT